LSSILAQDRAGTTALGDQRKKKRMKRKKMIM
jgi:hypothetical protein